MSPRKTVATTAKRAWGGSATSPGRRSATRRSAIDQRAIEAALSNPDQAQPDTVLQLQRLGGNGAVRGLLSGRRVPVAPQPGAPFIQRHKAEPKPGEDQQDADDDDSVQRSVDRGAQAPAVQRANIKKGKPLPDLNVETGKKLNKALGWDPRIQTLAGARMLKKLLVVVQTNASVRAAMGPAGATATDDVLRDVREAYVDPLRTALAKLRKIAVESRGGLKTSDATGLVFDIENEVDTELRAKFKGADLQARKAVMRAIGSAYGDRGGAAREVFDAARGGMRMEPAYLPPAARGQFAAALKLLPVMKTLTVPGGAKVAVLGGAQGGQGSQGGQGAQANMPSEWAGGGKLSDTVVVKPSKGIPGWLSKRRAAAKMQKFKAKVDAVDAWVRMMVEPELLRRVPRPEMVMHTRGRMRALGNTQRFAFLPDASGYRPNYTDPEKQEPGRVHLPYDEVHSLIAHEVGHAIEGFLPIQSWHDMNLLLERRHEAKVGSSRAARTGATMWTSGLVTNEGRYAGTYETGKYTSTAYDDGGNSEVFSQAMEFFSNPANAMKLIDGDPQHAAIVLRAIRPNEYRSIDALREFDKYLPRKGGGGAG